MFPNTASKSSDDGAIAIDYDTHVPTCGESAGPHISDALFQQTGGNIRSGGVGDPLHGRSLTI